MKNHLNNNKIKTSIESHETEGKKSEGFVIFPPDKATPARQVVLPWPSFTEV